MNLLHRVRRFFVSPAMLGLALSFPPLLQPRAHALAEPAARRTYRNPVLAGDYPDPSILRVGKTYYMTNTSEMYAPGLLIWRSRDLVHWAPVTYALKRYDGYVAAPCLVYYRHRFMIYYTPGRSTHVVYARRIQGPWSKPVKLKRKGRPFAAFDPDFVTGPHATPYLVGAGDYLVRLAKNGLSVIGKRRHIYGGWPIPKTWNVECGCLESPKIIFHDGYYHLFSAEGGTSGPPTSHMIVEARARTLRGPWQNSPYNPIVHTFSRHDTWWSTGHGAPVLAPNGRWYVYFHGYRKHYLTLGRSVLLEPVRWTAGGWLKRAKPRRPGRPAPYPGGQAVARGMRLSDDFTGKTLGLQWRFWKQSTPARYQLKPRALLLRATGPTLAASPPMVCITGAHAYSIQVQVHVEPGAQAGLVLFYNPSEYVGIGIGRGRFWFSQQGRTATAGAFSGSHAVLKIVNDHNAVECFGGNKVAALKKIGVSLYVGGYTHQTFGRYLSLRPGLYCVGHQSATFRQFTFTAHPGKLKSISVRRPIPAPR